VEGIARAGNGTALFASLEERLEKKVLQQLQDALQPAMTGSFVWNCIVLVTSY
jgi:von Willebrand factor A domain-containing protein 5